METLDGSNAAATTSADIEKSHESDDASHVIASSANIEKSHASDDLSHDAGSIKIEKPHESDDSSHDAVITSSTDVEKSHASDDSSHEVEATSCDSEVDPSLASDERYAYLQKGFTTEIYKIEICNLPPYLGYQVPS